jgi:all-trans-retinol 13,14-reductase
VISDAGVVNTFGTLIDPEIRRSLGLNAMLDQVRPAVSHNCLYVGLDSSAQALDLNPSNCWIYPEYDHDENVRRFLADESAPMPVIYISFPSAKDPDWNRRHPGKSTIEVLSYAPHEWFHRWEGSKWKKRGSEYEDHKAELSEQLLQQLYSCVPAAKGKVAYHELSTPLSTAHFSNHAAGAIYGIEHTPARFRLRWLRPHTPVHSLFLTGQDIVTGGVVGALFSGVVTASAILQKNLLKDIVAKATA